MSQDTTASGKRFTFTPKNGKYILKRLYYADSCDKIQAYYQSEILHSNSIINGQLMIMNEQDSIIADQNKALELGDSIIKVQKKKLKRGKFEKLGLIALALAIVIVK